MRLPQITAHTMGVANPHQVGADRDYAWNGDPAKSLERDPEVQSGDVRAARRGTGSSKGRADRLALYFAARDAGQGKLQAAAAAGVTAPTGRVYEKEWEAARKQQGTAS